MKSFFGNVKYMVSFIIPIGTLLAIKNAGWESWLPVIIGFAIIPLLELVLPYSKENLDETVEMKKSEAVFFDILLYVNVPLLFTILFYFLYRVSNFDLATYEYVGLTISTGMTLGVLGINVAHELGHRVKKYERVMAKMLLLPNNYMHFIIEHNRGHHKNVSTPVDSASARYNEVMLLFYFRSITGGYRSAWELEKMRLERAGLKLWSIDNEMLRFAFFQLAFAVGIIAIFGWIGLGFYLAASLIGVLLLESVNYVEHYGLVRREVAPGIYEKVKPKHSWNSDHELGRIFLFELTRHSDHHFKAQRKYQILRHFDESPQLPTGYPGCIVLALFPPLWFSVMNPRVKAINEQIDNSSKYAHVA
jgi:alkane 1-monooxygenase